MHTCAATIGIIALAVGLPAALGQKPPAKPPQTRLQLRTPVRAAVTPNGQLLVTDYKLRKVCRVEPDGHSVGSSFDVAGLPTAIGVLGDRIFVGNESARRVEIYTLTGQLLGTLGGAGFVVEDPRDLAVDPLQNRIYVVDGVAKHVKVFDTSVPSGQLVTTIGTGGTYPWEFQHPTGIALDLTNQEVLVADFGSLGGGVHPRVVIFGFDGSYHSAIDGYGGPTGQYFARPQGLLVGSSGHLFVVDSWRGEVIVIDRATAAPVATLGKYGTNPGELLLPLDLVAFGVNEDLYVTNTNSHRVEFFAQGGQL